MFIHIFDQAVHLDENLPKVIVVENKTTTEQIKLIQQLDDEDKKAIFRIISTMVANNCSRISFRKMLEHYKAKAR